MARWPGTRRIELTALGSLQANGHRDGTPRSVSFNVHGFCVAVQPRTSELRILHSVQAADAGHVINPMQCPGQIEGGAAQALGAALYEAVMVDDAGWVSSHTFRAYHVPTCADVPVTEVLFADTADRLGPFGAKSMSEAPYNIGQCHPGRSRRAISVHPDPHRSYLAGDALGRKAQQWLRTRMTVWSS
jgi:putative selenate reductase molybdopterin-binding subunit